MPKVRNPDNSGRSALNADDNLPNARGLPAGTRRKVPSRTGAVKDEGKAETDSKPTLISEMLQANILAKKGWFSKKFGLKFQENVWAIQDTWPNMETLYAAGMMTAIQFFGDEYWQKIDRSAELIVSLLIGGGRIQFTKSDLECLESGHNPLGSAEVHRHAYHHQDHRP
ncbi:MAG: hypothetical protein M1368_06865 [Thaumarchaeota archaeon]|nr:hypothetical protein [Nitrososphaerota archaeon]